MRTDGRMARQTYETNIGFCSFAKAPEMDSQSSKATIKITDRR